MLSSFNKLLSYIVLGLKGPQSTDFIQRDDLSTKKVKKVDFLASSEPSLSFTREDDKRSYGNNINVEEKDVIRMKVKMTKEEAARLMSKCKEGGIIEFRDLAHELVHIPVNCVTVVSSTCGYGGLLTTNPE